MSKHTGPLSGASDFLKASYIRRWGIVCTTHEQSIAEHMYRVWTLIRVWGPEIDLSSTNQAFAEEWALTHDLAEVRTGDMPTPNKTPEVKNWLDQVEHSIYPPIKLTEAGIRGTAVGAFCKHCDICEAILFLKLYGMGRHAMDVRDVLQLQMAEALKRSAISEHHQAILLDLLNTTLEET